MSNRCADPNDPLNSPKYHTGKPCVERGCVKPAGTAWSPFWCQAHNAERMARVNDSMEIMLEAFQRRREKTESTPPETK